MIGKKTDRVWSKRKFYLFCLGYYLVVIIAVGILIWIERQGIITNQLVWLVIALVFGALLAPDLDVLLFSYKKYLRDMEKILERRDQGKG